MTTARQRQMSTIGKSGCYFLAMVRAAEDLVGHRIDAVEVYETVTTHKFMDTDCYVTDAAAVMNVLTGKHWAVRHDKVNYKPANGEIMIMRYERQGTGVLFSHFVLCNADGTINYDPYGDSITVRDGKAVSSRIFTPL